MAKQDANFWKIHDPLTGMYNRYGFYEAARKMLNAHPRTRYCLVRTNIVNFKLVNSLFGRAKGDEILIQVGKILERATNEYEVYGRIHGDQFALLVEIKRFQKEGEELIRAAAKEISAYVDHSEYRLQINIGVYEIKDPSMEIPMMSDRAHLALLSITDTSYCSFAYYTDELMTKAIHDQTIISEFDYALETGEFEIYLQAQTDRDGTLMGTEALARWNKKDVGIIPPADFIPVLEQAGMIYRLDLFVWRRAAELLRSFIGTPMEYLSVSVNISPRDLYYVDLVKTFDGLVKEFGVDPGKLHLEITETAMFTDPEAYLSILANLREMGFHIEIDDFGSGYSSLNLLKDLEADVLKIDMGFLRETENRQRSRKILKAVIDMALELGMHVICEGVETKAQLEQLIEMRCELFQGYYFCRPMPAADFLTKYFPDACEPMV